MLCYAVAFLCPSRTLIATTHPTPPPPNPTTGREETPPTTNQQTQEPVDPLTTSDGPATDSEGITGTELKVPTTSETATDLPILSPSESTDVGLINIIGSVTAGIVVIILTLIIVMIAIAVLLKKHVTTEGYLVNNAGAVPTTSNQAYGLTRHGDGKSKVEENIYSYPEVNIATIGAKQNEAYGTHTDIITTEVNQAYGSANITTEINSAYGQIIDSETANDYHSVITQ